MYVTLFFVIWLNSNSKSCIYRHHEKEQGKFIFTHNMKDIFSVK